MNNTEYKASYAVLNSNPSSAIASEEKQLVSASDEFKHDMQKLAAEMYLTMLNLNIKTEELLKKIESIK